MRLFSLLIPLFLFASIKEEIINFYQSHYPTIKIEKITSNKPLPKNYKTLKIMINPKSSSGLIMVDKKYYYIKIKAKIPAYKATTIIRVNAPLIDGVNVKKELIDFRYLYAKPIEKLKNVVASSIISKNSLITTLNTKTPSAVTKGQKVSVIVKTGAVEIISSAKAMKDGNIGEVIPIEMNKKIFNAKIIKKGVVTIE